MSYQSEIRDQIRRAFASGVVSTFRPGGIINVSVKPCGTKRAKIRATGFTADSRNLARTWVRVGGALRKASEKP